MRGKGSRRAVQGIGTRAATHQSQCIHLLMRCFILSGRGGCCTVGVAGIGAGGISVGVVRGTVGTEARRSALAERCCCEMLWVAAHWRLAIMCDWPSAGWS